MSVADRIMVVDDDPAFLRLLTIHLNSLGYETQAADSAATALSMLDTFQPALVITDLRMDNMDGIALVKALREASPGLPVIIVTAHGSISEAVEATHNGAFGFLTKPIHKGELRQQISNALKISHPTGRTSHWAQELISRSATMEKLLRTAQISAAGHAHVLVMGEPGTGKTHLARLIHDADQGHHDDQDYCQEIDGALATAAQVSAVFERNPALNTTTAQTQTNSAAPVRNLFIKHVDAMEPDALTALQAGLEKQEVMIEDPRLRWRVISTATTIAPQPDDMRDNDIPIAPPCATDHALGGSTTPFTTIDGGQPFIASRSLAEDSADASPDETDGLGIPAALYYRLCGVKLVMPALRDRREDIPSLVDHFLLRSSHLSGQRLKTISPAGMDVMIAHNWPGNVRQLVNTVEQVITLTPGQVVSDATVREAVGTASDEMPSFAEAREDFTRNYLTRLMTLTDGNVSRAARLAKRNRTEFYKLLARFSVEPQQFKPDPRA